MAFIGPYSWTKDNSSTLGPPTICCSFCPLFQEVFLRVLGFSPTFPNSNSNHVDDELILNIYFIYLLLVTFDFDLKNTCRFQHEHGTELPLVETIEKSLSSQQTRVISTFREDRRPHDGRAVRTHPP